VNASDWRLGCSVIICLCKSVGHKQIEKLVAEGCTTLDELVARTGVTTGCGRCGFACEEMLVRAQSGHLLAAQPHLFHDAAFKD
jgi:bacterioferritin-associated ferredoxin